MSKRAIITGGGGFIGLNLARRLLKSGVEVQIIDNFFSSRRKQLIDSDINFHERNLCEDSIINDSIFKDTDVIYHLAADVDNRNAFSRPHELIKNNINATLNVGLAARNFGIEKIVYSSTGTIYGDNDKPPFREQDEDSFQSSLYGATKYSGEGILGVISTHFGVKVVVFRFVGVLGPGYTHGHIFDFTKKLLKNSAELEVLGDGNQKKSYVNVEDVIDALLLNGLNKNNFEVYNLGRRDFSTVKDSINWITELMNVDPEIKFGTNQKGWIGDNPNLYLDTSRIENLGWKPKHTIEESVKSTADWLLQNQWVFSDQKSL
jgi:UDP-glucose 4-epimerase